VPNPPPSPISSTAGIIEKSERKKSKSKKKKKKGLKKENDEKSKQQAPDVNQGKPNVENEQEPKVDKQHKASQGLSGGRGTGSGRKRESKRHTSRGEQQVINALTD